MFLPITPNLNVQAASEPLVQEEQHWVYNELKDFKQRIFPHAQRAISQKLITQEQWDTMRGAVFNSAEFDQPIAIENWAILLTMALDLPADKLKGLTEAYVTNLGEGNRIKREAAGGGLYKLLTIHHISGSITEKEFEPSKALEDLPQIEDRQRSLVQSLYIRGLLDGTVTTKFRPKDWLTSAEAISMLDRTLKAYEFITEKQLEWPTGHWSYSRLGYALLSGPQIYQFNRLLSDAGLLNTDPDTPITLKEWDFILKGGLKLLKSNREDSWIENYTYKLIGDSSSVPRDKAIASLMKLWPAVEQRDASTYEMDAAAAHFADFKLAFDRSKLAMAYSIGLVVGYNGNFEPARVLTKAEAVVLISKMIAVR